MKMNNQNRIIKERIPVRVIGFDDIKEGVSCNPPLTTIKQPCIDIFENGSPGGVRTVKIPTSLVMRELVRNVTGNQ
jgi:DNA-binding LacI/PurR family transcriptional regulator